MRRTLNLVISGALAFAVLTPPPSYAADTLLSGTIVDETGTPVSSLDVFSGLATVTTGADGTFTVSAEPGPATLEFYDNDYQQFGFDRTFATTAAAGTTTNVGTITLASAPNRARSVTAIDTSRKTAVRRAVRTLLEPTLVDERDLRPRGCRVAQTPLRAQERTIAAVNFMRSLVGIDPVALDPVLSQRAQKSALIQHYLGGLSHAPSPRARCYTKAGGRASGRSNLAMGYEGARVVLGYMADPGSGNVAVGHRRWLMNPLTEAMGTGQVGRYNAMYVVSPASLDNPTPAYLSWPTAGYFPARLEPAGRWSFSSTRRDVSFARAKVTVAVEGVLQRLRRYPSWPGMGDQETVVWDLARRIPRGKGAVVTITGVTQRGVAIAPISYTVTLVR